MMSAFIGASAMTGSGSAAATSRSIERDVADQTMARATPVSRSLLVMALAALAAAYLAVGLFGSVRQLLQDWSVETASVAGGALLASLILARVGWRSYAGLVLILVFALQLNWSGWVDPRPIGDLAGLWDDARRLAAGLRAGEPDWTLLRESPSPSALAVYGGVILVVSEDLSVLRVLCAALWTLQTWFVWRIARLVAETRAVASLAAALFGLAPAVMIFGGLPSVEAMFGAFALGSVYSLLSYRRRGLVRSAALSGFLAGLAILARPVGYGHVIGLTIIMVLAIGYLSGSRPKWRMAMALAFFWLGAGLAITPQAAIIWSVDGAPPSGPPALGLGYELYLGTDRASDGAYNESVSPAALAQVGYGGLDSVSAPEADARALAAAAQRFGDDPAGQIRFAAIEKTQRAWRDHERLLRWSVNSPSRQASPNPDAMLERVMPAATNGAMMALLAAALLGALRITVRQGAVRDPTRWILLFMTFLCVAAVVGLLEARDRNAFALTPFLALLAPMASVRMPSVVRRGRPAISGEDEERDEERAETQRRPVTAHSGAPRGEAARTEAAESEEPFYTEDLDQTELKVDPNAPASDRLAHVLAGMSKPKRRSEND